MKKSAHSFRMKTRGRLSWTTLVTVVLLSGLTSYAQSNTEDWQLLKESDGVKVYYVITHCDSGPSMHLKIENGNQSGRTIAWVASIRRENVDVWVIPSTTAPRQIGAGEHVSSSCAQSSPELTILLADASEVNNVSLHLNVQL